MRNGWAQGNWKKAIKILVAIVCGQVIASKSMGLDLATLSAWIVIGKASLTVAALNEAAYWYNWANSKEEGENKT